jgi:hypothetical protein
MESICYTLYWCLVEKDRSGAVLRNKISLEDQEPYSSKKRPDPSIRFQSRLQRLVFSSLPSRGEPATGSSPQEPPGFSKAHW